MVAVLASDIGGHGCAWIGHRHDRIGNGALPPRQGAAIHRRCRDAVRGGADRGPGMTGGMTGSMAGSVMGGVTALSALLNAVQVVGLLSCFALLATSRIGACIRWLSFQGVVFGLVPLLLHDDALGLRAVLLAGANIALKGVVFPWLLLRIRARAEFNREVDPFVGYIASILFGVVA